MAKVKEARTLANGNRGVTRYEDTVAPAVTDDAKRDVIANVTRWTVVDVNGQPTAEYLCTDSTAGAAVWKILQSDDLTKSVFFIEETVVFTGSASKNLVAQLPKNAVPLAGICNNDSLIGCTTAVKIGVGTAASLIGFCLSASLVKNAKQQDGKGKGALCGVALAVATTIQISAVDTNGAAAGTADSGTFRARVYYELYDNLADAA